MRSPALVLLPLACVGCMQTYVRGRVTDCRDSSPIEGADVQLAAKDQGAAWEAQQTGGDGTFVFKVDDRKAMPVVLTAAKRGYQTSQRTYSSGSDDDVCMRPTVR